MFRALPGSDKPRRRIDAAPEKWQALRDDLHMLTLANGEQWLELAERTSACPIMSGRNFELWQPLLALAAWLDDRGANGLLSAAVGTRREQQCIIRATAKKCKNPGRPRACDLQRYTAQVFSAPCRTRTYNPLIKSQLLCQLS